MHIYLFFFFFSEKKLVPEDKIQKEFQEAQNFRVCWAWKIKVYFVEQPSKNSALLLSPAPLKQVYLIK